MPASRPAHLSGAKQGATPEHHATAVNILAICPPAESAARFDCPTVVGVPGPAFFRPEPGTHNHCPQLILAIAGYGFRARGPKKPASRNDAISAYANALPHAGEVKE